MTGIPAMSDMRIAATPHRLALPAWRRCVQYPQAVSRRM